MLQCAVGQITWQRSDSDTSVFFPPPVRHVWLPDVKEKRRRNRKLNINSNEATEREADLKTLRAVLQINRLSSSLLLQSGVTEALQHSYTLQTEAPTPSGAASFSLNAPSPHLLPHSTVPLSISTELKKTIKADDKLQQHTTTPSASKVPLPTSACVYSWLRSQTTGDCVTLLEAQRAALRHCLLPVQPMIQLQAQG